MKKACEGLTKADSEKPDEPDQRDVPVIPDDGDDSSNDSSYSAGSDNASVNSKPHLTAIVSMGKEDGCSKKPDSRDAGVSFVGFVLRFG